MAKVVSVNLAHLRQVPFNGEMVGTGIYKEAVSHPVRVAKRGVEGDRVVDTRVHGGVDKAVYGYPHEHYSEWQKELGRDDFVFGQFGENLTTQGLLEDVVRIGDAFRVGSATLEVSQPRVPCFKLGVKMRMPDFPKRLVMSLRCGFYFRVREEGDIEAGDAIEQIDSGEGGMTVEQVFRLYFFEKTDRAAIERALELDALSGEWKKLLRQV